MKIQNKYVRYTVYVLILLTAIFVVSFSSIAAYIHHDTNQKQDASAKEKEENPTKTESETSEDTTATSAITKVDESGLMEEQRQIYITFYPIFLKHMELYDKAWEELWQPSIDMIHETPSVALDTLTILSVTYEKQAKNIRELSLPTSLPVEDMQKFDDAAELFASAMEERQKEAFFAAVAVKNGTFEDQTTVDYIKECAENADDYFVEGAGLVVELNEKYDFTP